MSEKRLFGTDGIRGVAGEFPLDPETLRRTGFALATVLTTSGTRPRILIGRDTRESGLAIEEALSEGLAAGQVKVTSGGVLSTPAVAFLIRDGGFDAGIVISASHNPYRDNGIKVFSGDGFKLQDRVEHQVEALVLDGGDEPLPAAVARPSVYGNGSDPLLRTRYLSYLQASLSRGFSFEGRRVVLDCAHGAATPLAPEIFRRLGAEVHAIGVAPDGRNINLGQGALHPEALAHEVVSQGAILGAAYDGDADRCILVDDKGTVRDGDDVIAVAAGAMQAAGALGEAGLVSTVMSNLGLELYLKALGVAMTRVAVGDKYVLEEMVRRGAVLGGEQSGHIIFLDRATTGDGILTSLRIAQLVVQSGRPLSELASCWTRLPQVLLNVRVARRSDLRSLPAVAALLQEVEAAMQGRGRLLVRFSGTEPLVRIMLEGEDRGEIEGHATRIAEALTQALA